MVLKSKSKSENPTMTDLTVIVMTFNEERNLSECLDSVSGWAREIFVVDSYSTDRTVDIALSRSRDGVGVVQHRFENYSSQWNWALRHLPIKGAWTLKLDADERVTPAFKKEAEAFWSAAEQDAEGVYFRRAMIFMGHRLRWGGTTNNYDLRLWKSGKAAFENRSVNEHALVKGKTIRFHSFVDHLNENSKGLADWIEKHNRYSSMEAAAMMEGNVTGDVKPRLFGEADQRRMWLRRFFWKFPLRHFLFFLYRYIVKLGFLDGKTGFRYAFLHGIYFYWIGLKQEEGVSRNLIPYVPYPARGAAHPKVMKSALQKLVDKKR